MSGAVIPNFLIAEYFVNFAEICAAVATSAVTVTDGWAEFGDTPGLGVEFDTHALRANPYEPFGGKGLTDYRDEFPRKDYVPGIG